MHFNLLISLDGDELNNSYRVDKNGKGVFERITKNVEGVRSNYPEYFSEKVNFNSVLHNRNSVASIHGFFKEHFGKFPSIGELNNSGIRADMVAEFNETYRNVNESLHQSENYEAIEKELFMNLGIFQSLTIFLHQYSGFVYRDYLDLLYKPKIVGRIPTGNCIPFAKKVFVTVNGKILPCERIGHQFGLGEISETTVEIDFQVIANRYNQYFEKLKTQCHTCHNVTACIQCIFNLSDIEKNPTCYGHMNSKQFSNYVAYNMEHLRNSPEDYPRIMKEVIFE